MLNIDPATVAGFIPPQQAPGEPTPTLPPLAFLVDCPYGTTTYARYPDDLCECLSCTEDMRDDRALDMAGL